MTIIKDCMDGQQNQCNTTDASPHLTTRLLHLDLYSDLESRFGPMQPRKPAQDTLSHTGRMQLCHFSVVFVIGIKKYRQ